MSRTNEPPAEAVPTPPRGALLYVPGANRRMVQKAAARGAEVLVLDLEDGVHPAAKAEARARLAAARERLGAAGAKVVVRVNHPESEAGRADLRAARNAGFDAVLVPKAERREQVRAVPRALGRGIPVWLMVETAGGLASVFRLASEPGVAALVFGSADYRLSLGALPAEGDSDLGFARDRLLVAARANGLGCWDAPWFAFRDLEGLRASAREAFRRGFDGKSAVHPAQIPVIQEAFRPSAGQLAWARRVVRALEAAAARGEAVAELDGRLVEELHLRQARRLLLAAE